jgi:uncharacterized protein
MLYFDSSFIFAVVFDEHWSVAAEAYLRNLAPNTLFTSDWSRTEFGGALAGKIRNGIMDSSFSGSSTAYFHDLINASFDVLTLETSDFAYAQRLLLEESMIEAGLRPGDALHLACAIKRRASCFYTLDRKLLKAASKLHLNASHAGLLDS